MPLAPLPGTADLSAHEPAHRLTERLYPTLVLQLASAQPFVVLGWTAHAHYCEAPPPFGLEAVRSAGRLVLAAVQRELAGRCVVEPTLRRELRIALSTASVALLSVEGTRRRVASLQHEATCGAPPLTFCFGVSCYDVPSLKRTSEFAYPHGDGCGRVFQGSPFRRDCPSCREHVKMRKKRAASRERAFREGRLPVPLFDAVTGVATGEWAWLGTCSRCGLEMLNYEPHATRCEACRRRHR